MITINKLVSNSIVITTGGGDDPELRTPLYFEANESGASVAMLCYDDYDEQPTSIKCHLQYSIDMATWETWDGSNIVLANVGDKVYFRADPENPNTDGFHKDDWDHDEAWTHYFKTDKSVKAGGNIQFLLESTGTRTDVPEYGYYQLFGYEEYDEEIEDYTYSCESLTTAPILPATTLANDCYSYMFNGCTSLTTAPALPATTLANWCYGGMFQYCTSLISAPELPATTLAESCYNSMFSGCTSLTTAPALPAETLANNCYGNMFNNCSSLTTAPILSAENLAESCCQNMFQDCTSLTIAPALPATTLANDCYTSMFAGCTSLTTAPALPATTLAKRCYTSMFERCTSLISAPELPATTLASACYSYMFQRCSSLMTVPALPATTLVTSCYYCMFNLCSNLASINVNFTAWNSGATQDWVRGVAASGTFTCPSTLPKTTGISNIPSGWTIVEK